jgi:hypothetical protein
MEILVNNNLRNEQSFHWTQGFSEDGSWITCRFSSPGDLLAEAPKSLRTTKLKEICPVRIGIST